MVIMLWLDWFNTKRVAKATTSVSGTCTKTLTKAAGRHARYLFCQEMIINIIVVWSME